jgi:hypothetical protein
MKKKSSVKKFEPDASAGSQNDHQETPIVPPVDPCATEDPEESSDLDDAELSDTDDGLWDAFILDDDELDPLPNHGDFWFPD